MTKTRSTLTAALPPSGRTYTSVSPPPGCLTPTARACGGDDVVGGAHVERTCVLPCGAAALGGFGAELSSRVRVAGAVVDGRHGGDPQRSKSRSVALYVRVARLLVRVHRVCRRCSLLSAHRCRSPCLAGSCHARSSVPQARGCACWCGIALVAPRMPFPSIRCVCRCVKLRDAEERR